MTLHFWGIALCHLLRAVTQELIIKLTRYRPERRRSSCIKSLNSRLNALIAPGVNRTKNGPGLKKKCCCLIHVQITYDCDFLLMGMSSFFETEMAPQPSCLRLACAAANADAVQS